MYERKTVVEKVVRLIGVRETKGEGGQVKLHKSLAMGGLADKAKTYTATS